MATAADIQGTPMREGGMREAIAGLPRDVQLALATATLLLLQIEGSFLLGTSGPGLTPSMWSLVVGANLAVALGISFGILRDRRVTRVSLEAAGLLAAAWVLPYSMLLAPPVFFSLFVLVPAAALLSTTALFLSLARHERRGREFLIRLLLLALLLTVTICCILPSPGSWMWQLDTEARILGVRTAVTSRVSLGALQSAAVELLERDSRRPTTEGPLRLTGPQISAEAPEPIRRLRPQFVMAVPRWGERESHVAIVWGWGIMRTWGVKLGRPTFRLGPDERVRRWREGIYGYRGD